MKTDINKKLFLVNRNTGENIQWDSHFGEELPHHSFFRNGNFIKNGQVVELVLIEEIETEYFGIMYRKDKMTVLQRGQLESYGIKTLD